KFGLLIVNPNLTNRQRAELLGRAIFGSGRWICGTALAIGLNKQKFRMRMGIALARYGVSHGAQYDVEDKDVTAIIKLARRRIKELEMAIELARLPPFIDG